MTRRRQKRGICSSELKTFNDLNKKKKEVKDMEAIEENVNGQEVEDHYKYEKKKNMMKKS